MLFSPLLLDLALPRHPSFPPGAAACTAILESQPDHHQAARIDCIIAHHETIALTHALADWRTDTAKKESTEKPGTHRRRGRCGRRGRRFSATMTPTFHHCR